MVAGYMVEGYMDYFDGGGVCGDMVPSSILASTLPVCKEQQ